MKNTGRTLSETNQIDFKREMRPVIPLGNGFMYQGEWDKKSNLRDGKGVMIWPNGSRYDGWWANDVACGYGRLVQTKGSVYEGDWLNNKASGFGVYTQ